MRRFFTFIAVIISIIFLFAGHTYWKHKTTSINVEKTSVKDAASSTSKEKSKLEKARPMKKNWQKLRTGQRMPKPLLKKPC